MKCLLIHGFGGGVHEVQPLAEFLRQQGHDVICPVLTGHAAMGQSVNSKELAKAKWQDWIASAEQGLLQLDPMAQSEELEQASTDTPAGQDVALIGFSMGGLIAFQLASRCKVRTVITINTPIFYWNLPRVVMNLADDVKHRRLNHTRRYLDAKGNSPIPAMLQFLKLLYQTKPILPKVACPVLILQAKDDDTVRQKSVDYMWQHLGSVAKSVKYFDHGGHLILHSGVADQVMATALDFLNTQHSI